MITQKMITENEDEYMKYFDWLEGLRQSGITNMFGASPYLEAEFGLSETDAVKILVYWMNHYSELSEKRGWRDDDN